MIDTQILKSTDENISYCVSLIKSSDVVAMPTETVYGLAASAYDKNAVAKIFDAKGRPQDNPLICHISNFDMLLDLTCKRSNLLYMIAEKFWPGPLTVIVPKNDCVLDIVTAGLDTVAIRFPSHSIAQKLINECGFPLVAPSANLSGTPSPTTAAHVYDDLNGKIKAILDGGTCKIGVESTIIKVDDNEIKLLRPGVITVKMLQEVCKNITVDINIFNKPNENIKVISPGVKYKHYSPKANVILVDGNLSQFKRYISNKLDDNTFCVVFDEDQEHFKNNVLTYGKDSLSQAHNIFSILRKVDDLKAKTVFIRCPQKTDIGLAVYNRLLRASGFNLVKL